MDGWNAYPVSFCSFTHSDCPPGQQCRLRLLVVQERDRETENGDGGGLEFTVKALYEIPLGRHPTSHKYNILISSQGYITTNNNIQSPVPCERARGHHKSSLVQYNVSYSIQCTCVPVGRLRFGLPMPSILLSITSSFSPPSFSSLSCSLQTTNNKHESNRIESQMPEMLPMLSNSPQPDRCQ